MFSKILYMELNKIIAICIVHAEWREKNAGFLQRVDKGPTYNKSQV